MTLENKDFEITTLSGTREITRYGSDAQYGATFTFFEYLENKYGNDIIGEMVNQLGSGMITNHRCDTLENCAVLQGAYDEIGLDIQDERYPLSVEKLIEGWEEYVMDLVTNLSSSSEI